MCVGKVVSKGKRRTGFSHWGLARIFNPDSPCRDSGDEARSIIALKGNGTFTLKCIPYLVFMVNHIFQPRLINPLFPALQSSPAAFSGATYRMGTDLMRKKIA